ncbi:Uncharacterized protein HZ326_3079 [Fusarium oxysporum f. sp. albedinis]|nr:Uncharacterized protein HZ326_3079 [Fusarium oxysporum f. sp. albedinis]
MYSKLCALNNNQVHETDAPEWKLDDTSNPSDKWQITLPLSCQNDARGDRKPISRLNRYIIHAASPHAIMLVESLANTDAFTVSEEMDILYCNHSDLMN